MPPSPNPLDALNLHYTQIAPLHLRQLFADDLFRFERFSLNAAGLMLDYSKNRLTEKAFTSLIEFAYSLDLPNRINDLFQGKFVNNTENRPALHTALRDTSAQPLYIEDVNINEAIAQMFATMEKWIDQLHARQWLGFSQKPISHIVHIGIGGSHLGPLLASEALAKHKKAPQIHFVASVDPIELDSLLKKLHPETTLFIVASKTFTTQETLTTAERAKNWFLTQTATQDISQHFIATTAGIKQAIAFGIAPHMILPLWDWVGGRYSLWSAIGLPLAMHIGMPQFKELLSGAYQMDQHFRTAPLNANMPVILGLLAFWYTHFFKTSHHAVLPYDYRLRSLPRYLQQLDMESNGKCIQKDGTPVGDLTAPILFGEIGTNGQHSFHQLLFQGTHLIPCDFIATISSAPFQGNRAILLSHCLAQSRGLMLGKSLEEAYEELVQKGYDAERAKILAPHKIIPGNQPSNTILIDKLTPQTLGALIALYEHKVYVQGVLWDINSFDQWGVELGKEIAKELLDNLTQQQQCKHHDASTRGLLNYIYTYLI